MKRLVLFVVVNIFAFFIYSQRIEYSGEIFLENKGENFIQEPTSFFVTEDGYIYVFDAKASNLKIFSKNGKFIKTFGRRGLGPNEFIRPAYGTYNKGIVVINDLKRDHLFIYKKDKTNNLKYINKFFFSGIDIDIHFYGENRLLLSGLNSDKRKKGNPTYGVIIFNVLRNKISYILPLKTCFGFKDEKELDKKMLNGLIYLVPLGYVDFTKDYIFYVYAGDIRIIRFNRKTKKMISFGKKMKGYIKPYVTEDIINSARMVNGNSNKWKELVNKMSFVLKIFTVSNQRVLICYSKFNKNINDSELYLQSYDLSGKFIREFKLNEVGKINNSDIIFYFKKKKQMLYVIKTEIDANFNHKFILSKYRVTI